MNAKEKSQQAGSQNRGGKIRQTNFTLSTDERQDYDPDLDLDYGFPTFNAVEAQYKNEQRIATEILSGNQNRLPIKPEPLPDDLFPVVNFDFALLPESLQPWAQDICERVQCPPDFVAAGIMTSLAAIVGRKVGIRPQARTDWTVIPNLWAMVVGRPGVLKSPALEAAQAPLKRLVALANEEFSIVYSDYKKEQKIQKMRAEAAEKAARKELAKNPDADLLTVLAVDEVDVPTLKRYIANDTSPASLGELLRQNPNGLLVYRDELVSLLKGLDREDQAEGRGFYLTAWNGDTPYTFDRIGRGLNLHIEAVCISVLGSTQPGRLAEYIRHAIKGGAADDGLIQRFGLLVWPDTNNTWEDVDRLPNTDAKNQAFKVFDYLDKFDPAAIGAEQDRDIDGNPDGIPYLRFAVEGLELFLEWRTDLERKLREGELHPALESHFTKYRKLVPALALIIHLSNGNTGPVSAQATLQALAWSDYLKSHARRAYGAVSQPEVATAKAILRRINKGDLTAPFSSRDVWRPGWSMLSERSQVIEALQLLVDYGHLDEERVETRGRPATLYHLNEGIS
jgi:putative DNA primase/helicase